MYLLDQVEGILEPLVVGMACAGGVDQLLKGAVVLRDAADGQDEVSKTM